jgi:2'-5' RNA ligase
MPEFALAVPFPGLVERVCVEDNLPPHVTVLVPSPGEVAAIAEALAPFEAFDVTFARLDRFPEILWLAPERREPLRFPDYPPYGGIHERIVPHLTLAQAELEETAARVEPLLPLGSRVETVVLYEYVDADSWREVHTFGL